MIKTFVCGGRLQLILKYPALVCPMSDNIYTYLLGFSQLAVAPFIPTPHVDFGPILRHPLIAKW